MATGGALLSFSGTIHSNTHQFSSTKPVLFVTIPKGLNHRRSNHKLAVRAKYNDQSSNNGGDFVAGFLLGSAIFGTLAYVFAPQIRRSLLNEDESGFQKAKRPTYYDSGLEKTRETLNEKISQLNSAIDNVSSRLRGANNTPSVAIDTDLDQDEATI